MKFILWAFTFTFLIGCVSSPPDKDEKRDATSSSPAANTSSQSAISEIASVLQDTRDVSTIYLSTAPMAGSFITVPGELINNGGGWLAYRSVEGITNPAKMNITGEIFTYDKKPVPIKVELLNSDPVVSWTVSRGNNLSAELKQVIDINSTFSSDSIYEISIIEIGSLIIDDTFYNHDAFRTYVTSLYILENPRNISTSGFNSFKRDYGVITGGKIFNVIISKYNSVNVEGAGNVPGLIKANGKFYSKNGGSTRVSIARLSYAQANANATELRRAQQLIAATPINAEDVRAAFTVSEASPTPAQAPSTQAEAAISVIERTFSNQ